MLRQLGKNLIASDINDEASDEHDVEIYDIQTPEELVELKRYLLKTVSEAKSCDEVDCFNEHIKETFGRLTFGHEIVITYGWNRECFYIEGNGSAEDYGKHYTDMIMKLIEDSKSTHKYKLREYWKSGSLKGNVKNEYFFETKEAMDKKYSEMFEYKAYGLNPTAWIYDADINEWCRLFGY
jgi:hypothetical protein